MSTWIIDLEASGLDRKSYPIEVGITNGTISAQWLISPEKNWTFWCEKAAKIHNIPRQLLLSEGLPIKQVCHELNEILDQSTVYSDAQEWDSFWLQVLFNAANTPQAFTVKSIEVFLKTPTLINQYIDKKQAVLDQGVYQYHRALDDAKIIYTALDNTVNLHR